MRRGEEDGGDKDEDNNVLCGINFFKLAVFYFVVDPSFYMYHYHSYHCYCYPTILVRHFGTCAAVYYMLLAMCLQRLALRKYKYQLRSLPLLGGLLTLHYVEQ